MTLHRCKENMPFSHLDEQILMILADYATVALGKRGSSSHPAMLREKA
jgi:hypothetical protein